MHPNASNGGNRAATRHDRLDRVVVTDREPDPVEPRRRPPGDGGAARKQEPVRRPATLQVGDASATVDIDAVEQLAPGGAAEGGRREEAVFDRVTPTKIIIRSAAGGWGAGGMVSSVPGTQPPSTDPRISVDRPVDSTLRRPHVGGCVSRVAATRLKTGNTDVTISGYFAVIRR
jgi:hypothetical protein